MNDTRVDFEPDPRLFPFRSRFFESRVGPVHYIDEGAGPPLLFLHGAPTWSFLYRGIVIRLRSRFRCIAVDYPGFGLSCHPEEYGYTPAEHAGIVRDLVRHLELEKLTIMGQDWGGPIGMRVALDEAPRMHALVMGNSWYWPIEALHMRAFAAVMSSDFMQGQILRKNLFVEKVLPFGVKHKLAREVLDHYRRPFPDAQSRAGVAEFPRQLTRARGWLREIASEVPGTLGHLPLLLTWGVHDPAFPLPMIDRFREDFRKVRVLRLEARHFIQEDAPGEISQAIERFMGAIEKES